MNSPATGPDAGLVFGFALNGAGGGSALNWSDIAGGSPAGSLAWLHFDFTNSDAGQWLREKSGLDHVIVDALLDEDSRPRMLEHKGGMLVILRGVNTNPGAVPEDMVSIRVWLEPQRIISTRRRRLLSAVKLQESMQQGVGPKNSGDFLVQLVALLSDRIESAVEELDLAIEAMESKFGAGKSRSYGGEFGVLRRQSARIRRYLSPQRDALERLSRESNSLLSLDQCSKLREDANQMTRILEDLDLVRERSMVAQEELLGQLANEQNSRMYVLSLVAAIFLPLSFLTGMMGMNVAGMPGTENVLAFGIISLLMIGTAIGIIGVFRWRKWL